MSLNNLCKQVKQWQQKIQTPCPCNQREQSKASWFWLQWLKLLNYHLWFWMLPSHSQHFLQQFLVVLPHFHFNGISLQYQQPSNNQHQRPEPTHTRARAYTHTGRWEERWIVGDCSMCRKARTLSHTHTHSKKSHFFLLNLELNGEDLAEVPPISHKIKRSMVQIHLGPFKGQRSFDSKQYNILKLCVIVLQLFIYPYTSLPVYRPNFIYIQQLWKKIQT